MIALGLLLVGSGYAVHLQDVRGLDPVEAAGLATELSRAIGARTGTVAVIDDPAWGSCPDPSGCPGEIEARTGAGQILLVRAFAAGARMRVTLERSAVVTPRTTPREVLDLSRAPKDWGPPVQAAIDRLFPARTAAALVAAPPEPAPASPVLPWALIGAGAGMLGVGIALGASSASTLDALESGLQPAARVEQDGDRARGQAIAANVLFVGAALAVSGGLTWWLLE
jgi:hypothetical protein